MTNTWWQVNWEIQTNWRTLETLGFVPWVSLTTASISHVTTATTQDGEITWNYFCGTRVVGERELETPKISAKWAWWNRFIFSVQTMKVCATSQYLHFSDAGLIASSSLFSPSYCAGLGINCERIKHRDGDFGLGQSYERRLPPFLCQRHLRYLHDELMSRVRLNQKRSGGEMCLGFSKSEVHLMDQKGVKGEVRLVRGTATWLYSLIKWQ